MQDLIVMKKDDNRSLKFFERLVSHEIHNDLLLVGPITQLVEHCTGNVEVKIEIAVQA